MRTSAALVTYLVTAVAHKATSCRTEAREELRRQVGFFRFDLRNLATSRGTKDQRKEGLDKAKNLIKATERLDFTLTKKSKDEAKREYDVVIDKLKDFDSFVAA